MTELDVEKILIYNNLYDKFIESLYLVNEDNTQIENNRFNTILEKLGNCSSVDEFYSKLKIVNKMLSSKGKKAINCFIKTMKYYANNIIAIDISNSDYIMDGNMLPIYIRYQLKKGKISREMLAAKTETQNVEGEGVSIDTIKHLLAPKSMDKTAEHLKEGTVKKLLNAFNNPNTYSYRNKRLFNLDLMKDLYLSDDELYENNCTRDLIDKIEELPKVLIHFFNMEAAQCYLVTEFFDFYTKLTLEYWDLLLEYGKLNQEGKNLIINYLCIVKKKYRKPINYDDNDFVKMCLLMKKKIKEKHVVEEDKKIELWSKLKKKLLMKNTSYLTFNQFFERMDAYVTINDEDLNLLITYESYSENPNVKSDIILTLKSINATE